MLPSATFYGMMPAAGFLADLVLAASLWARKDRRRYDRPFLLLAVALANWNLGCLLYRAASTEAESRLLLYLMHQLHVLIAPAFLWTAMSLTGRRSRWPLVLAFVGSAAVWAMVQYSRYFVPGDVFMMAAVHREYWGFAPVAGPGARIYNLLFLFCIPTGLFFLFRPIESAVPRRTLRAVSFLFAAQWLATFANFAEVNGFRVYPIGNAVDAVVSVWIVGVLYREGEGGVLSLHLMRVASLIAALNVGLISSYLVVFLLGGTSLDSLAVLASGAVAGVASTVASGALFPARSLDSASRPIGMAGTLRDLGLDVQEEELCRLLMRGLAREEIAAQMGLKDASLKQLLKTVYGKTIERGYEEPTRRRDKLQRLTVFLQKRTHGSTRRAED